MASAKAAGALSGAASGAAAGSAFGPWGTAIGAVVGGVGGLLAGGAKAPQQATYTPVDPATVQRNAIAGNLANMGDAQKLAGQTNSFNQSEANRLLEQAMPGFSQLQKRMLQSVNEDLNSQNTLPQDVKDQISRFAAEKGVSRGTSGNFNGFNLVKDFGFNLVDWRNAQRARALNTMSTVFGMTPRVNPMSPMAMMVDPNTAIGVQGQNNQMAFNAQQAGYNAQTAASNYNSMLIQGALMNAANFAGTQMRGSPQPKAGATPNPQSGMGLNQNYSPLAGAKPFAMPAGT